MALLVQSKYIMHTITTCTQQNTTESCMAFEEPFWIWSQSPYPCPQESETNAKYIETSSISTNTSKSIRSSVKWPITIFIARTCRWYVWWTRSGQFMGSLVSLWLAYVPSRPEQTIHGIRIVTVMSGHRHSLWCRWLWIYDRANRGPTSRRPKLDNS